MKKIGVIANTHRPNAKKIIREIGEKAHKLGLKLFAEEEIANLLQFATPMPTDQFIDDVEMILSLGGDGTTLFCANILNGRNIPILGLNLGSLGFLTSVGEKRIDETLQSLLKGELLPSVRSVADCKIFDNELLLCEYRALNDMVISWGNSSHITTLALRINGEEICKLMCDGVIISTPTGSTGHSLSAGGPILHPETPVFVISIICPHSLSSRPLVIPDSSTIEIEVLKSNKKLVCSVDGQDVASEVLPGFKMCIKKSEKSVTFLQPPEHSYFEVLTKKLHWRGSSL